MAEQILQIDRFQERTHVLGPGARAAVWLHGCSRNCPGCVAAEMNHSDDFTLSTPEALAERVKAVDGIEGVTLSGGEPFQQSLEALGRFLALVRADTRLSVMVYSGYLLDELKADARTRPLLDYIDILVDGPYLQEQDHGELWRGSSNQKIHFLTERYAALAEVVAGQKGRPLEFKFQDGLRFSFTGIPPKGFRSSVRKALSEKGFDINW